MLLHNPRYMETYILEGNSTWAAFVQQANRGATMAKNKRSLAYSLLSGTAIALLLGSLIAVNRITADPQSSPAVHAWRNLYPALQAVFVTSDGKRQWAVGDGGTILAAG